MTFPDNLPLGGTGAPARARGAVVAAFTLAAFAALAYASLAPVDVRADGARTAVPVGATVADLVRAGAIKAPSGDLRSVSGEVLREGEGMPPVLRVNGAVATSRTPVSAGSAVTSERGPDAVEATTAVTVEKKPEMRIVGTGPVSSVEESGVPSQIRVVVGAVSGAEVSRTVLSEGEPMIVRREPAYTGAKRVALTFDDGPWPASTDDVLDLLLDYDAKATFFMVGKRVKVQPDTARRVRDSGMELGNHSWSHAYLSKASRKRIVSEISKADDAFEAELGQVPVWYRPAGGATNATVYREAARLDHRVVMWTVDPHDWKRPGARRIARRVLDNVKPGAVILLHDGGGNREQTVAALARILRGLEARGYEAVTLSELYGE